MVKNSFLNKHALAEIEDSFDFLPESPDENEMVAGIMGSMVEAGNEQMKAALELTKLIVAKGPDQVSEDKIFAIFKKASQAIADNYPMKSLLES